MWGVHGVRNVPRLSGRQPVVSRGLDLPSVARGAVIALMSSLFICTALGIAFFVAGVPEDIFPFTSDAIIIASSAIGGAYAGKRALSLGWLHGTLTGLAYIVIMALAGLAFARTGVRTAILVSRAAVALVIGAIGGMIGVSLE